MKLTSIKRKSTPFKRHHLECIQWKSKSVLKPSQILPHSLCHRALGLPSVLIGNTIFGEEVKTGSASHGGFSFTETQRIKRKLKGEFWWDLSPCWPCLCEMGLSSTGKARAFTLYHAAHLPRVQECQSARAPCTSRLSPFTAQES